MADSDVLFRSATELAAMVREGEVSSRELVETSLERIEELNPELNAFVEVDDEGALAAADAIAPGDERPFAGVPTAIKNNRPVTGMRLTYGCKLMQRPRRRVRPQRHRPAEAGRVRDRRHHHPARVRDPARQRGPHLRPHPQPVGPRTDARGLLRRGRRGGRGGFAPGGPRQRRRRLDPDPGRLLRAGGPEAEPGAHLAGPRAGGRGAGVRRDADPLRGGRGRDPRRARGLRARRRHLGPGPARAVRRQRPPRAAEAPDRRHHQAAGRRRDRGPRRRPGGGRRRLGCCARSATRSRRSTRRGRRSTCASCSGPCSAMRSRCRSPTRG